MNEPDPDLVLARARRALSPSNDDMLRVQATLQVELLNVPVEAGPAQLTNPARRWWHVPTGVALLGVAGAAGYGWGYRDGSAALATPVVVASAPSKKPAELPPVPAAVNTTPSAAQDRLPPHAVRPSAPHAQALVSASPPLGLDEEVRQLRRIEKALRDGNPRLALVIGEDLDAALPQGQLHLERSAARLMAQCQLGDEQATQEARQFVSDNMQSAYTARLRQICKL